MQEQTTETPRAPRYGVRVLTLWISIPVILIATLAGAYSVMKLQAAHKRAQWKGPALQRLSTLTADSEQIRWELEELRKYSPADNEFRWTQEHVLLMTNGEYIIFESRHGANSGFVDHLFLGHGSNGKWLYSSFHFCTRMAMISGDDPPGSIAEFEKLYGVREFDGKSDECLKHTWPVRN